MPRIKIRLTESHLNTIVDKAVKKMLKEYVDIHDEDHFETIPLFNVLKNYDLNNDDQNLWSEPLCDKDGNEIGYTLKDLHINYHPNRR